MCGIAGRVGSHAGSFPPIKLMTDSLIHRGPDEEGFYVKQGVELGSRRLAIIDVKEGQQPQSVGDGAVTVILNGEIYNYQELRQGLIEKGHNLKTHSDTEVVGWLYLSEGMDFVKLLRGMFAIAIWDTRDRSLVLVRDRLGKKPLLYCPRVDGGLDFASETKALLSIGTSREPDLASIDYVLAFGYAPPPMTGFKAISALPAGRILVWRDKKIQITEYWKFNSSKKTIFNMDEAISRTRETLEESVKLRLISERPIGVLLSGGIDSTLVTAFAAKNLSTKLNTYSIGFEDPKFDESKYAAKIADILGTEHHELIVKPDPEELVMTLSNTLDRPFADSSIFPTYLVSQFARSEVVVALGGDGGDEAFGGYSRYQIVEQMQNLNWLLRLTDPFVPVLQRISFQKGNQKLLRLASALRAFPSTQDRYMALVSLVHLNEREALWAETSSFASALSPSEWFEILWNGVNARGKFDRALAVDIESYLPEDLNFKTDIASMSNSLELRSPFQDHKLVELSGLISEKLKFHSGESKYILKKIAEDYVPKSLVHRKKMGFGIPRARWMREELRPLVAETLLGNASHDRGWFNLAEVRRQIDLHNRGIDRDRILWPLFAVELWAQNWID